MLKAAMFLSRKRGYVLVALTVLLAVVGGGAHHGHLSMADPAGW